MQTFNLDLSAKRVIPLLYAKQRDVGTKIRVKLTDNQNEYSIPEDVTWSVWYSGKNGEGNYTKIDDRDAVVANGSTATVELIYQMLDNPGAGYMCLVMNGADGTQLGLWNIPYFVEAIPGADSKAAIAYYQAFLNAQAAAEAAANRAEGAVAQIVVDQEFIETQVFSAGKSAEISATAARDAQTASADAQTAADAAAQSEQNAKDDADRAVDAADRAATLLGEVVKEVPTITVKYDGEILLTDDIVTLGAGWSGNLTDGFTHTAGYTEPLTFDIGSADGERYLVGANISTGNVSCLRLTIGNSYPTDPYGSNPWYWGVQSVDGGSLNFTPVSDWAGTIVRLDCRKITDDGEYEWSYEVDNIAHEAMPNHLSGFWDIQLGRDALRDSINTTRCIAIGKAALMELQTGGRIICLGTATLPHMKYGEDDIAIGADSGLYVKEAHGCVSIGKSAMSNGAKYRDCVSVGHRALYGNANTDAQNIIGIGADCGSYITTAKNNIFIGKNAGYRTTTGYNNVYIGDGAAKDATSGAFNTSIGVNTVIPSTMSNCVVLGFGATATKSKQAVLGGDNITETLLKGNLIVRGTDGVKRQIVFNTDGTCSWLEVTA